MQPLPAAARAHRTTSGSRIVEPSPQHMERLLLREHRSLVLAVFRLHDAAGAGRGLAHTVTRVVRRVVEGVGVIDHGLRELFRVFAFGRRSGSASASGSRARGPRLCLAAWAPGSRPASSSSSSDSVSDSPERASSEAGAPWARPRRQSR